MALQVLTASETPIKAVALVNPAVRIRSVVGLVEGLAGQAYRWTAESRKAADELDFVARAEDLRHKRRCCLSAGSGTTRNCARTRPTSSMHYASNMRTRTRSS